MAIFPPAPATLSGENLTASRFLKNPEFVARRLQELGDLRYRGTFLLSGRQDTSGGAVGYEQLEGIFADAAPEIVAPGGEYSLTTIANGPAGLARVAKYGKDTLITDEDVKRRNFDSINKGLLKLVNSAGQLIDQAVVSVIASAVTANRAAKQKWDGSGTTPSILQDILRAAADIRAQNLGYEPNALLVDDSTWAYLASDPVISAAMAREDKSNPIYTGRFEVLAGLEVIPTPAANLPGGVGTNAWVIDTNQLGFIATEDLGGNYQSAGDLVQSKVMRDEETDATRVRVRANFVPVVTDPGAGFRISGVA